VLIENVIRGSQWAYSVIGLGLNVQQTEFGPDLPHATSLNKELPARYNIRILAEEINSSILSALETQMTEQTAKAKPRKVCKTLLVMTDGVSNDFFPDKGSPTRLWAELLVNGIPGVNVDLSNANPNPNPI
jgi:biotin-(acetyl-CoA carboxylase) ligase